MKAKLVPSVLVLAALSLVGVGCGDDDSDATTAAATTEEAATDEGRTYVGKVDGTNAYIAIVTNSAGDQAGGYVCDGKKISVWIGQSALTDGSGELLTRVGSNPVGNVEVNSSGATGEVEIDGEAHSFTAELATGKAGLYHQTSGEGADYAETGWVVLADESFRGTKRTATTSSTAGSPSGGTVGWVDPATDPVRWIQPDVDP